MYGIRINNQFLDLYPNTVFSFDMNSPLYFGGDSVDEITGSFMYTVRVPLSAHNARLLDYPQIEGNVDTFLMDVAVSVFVEGQALYDGLLTVGSATRTDAEVYVRVESFPNWKTTRLDELNLGDFSTGGMGIAAFATQTVIDPDNYDFVCAPIHNVEFWSDEKDASTYNHFNTQNTWRTDSDSIVIDPAGLNAITPFLKLHFLLSKMMAHFGFRLINEWQTTRELRQILLYNATTVTLRDGRMLESTYPLNRLVSHSFCSDFFKVLCRTFCLAPIVDMLHNTVELIPCRDLLSVTPSLDWTSRVLANYEIRLISTLPTSFTSDKPSVYPLDFDKTRTVSTSAAYFEQENNTQRDSALYYLADTKQLLFAAWSDNNSRLFDVSLDNNVVVIDDSEKDSSAYKSRLGSLPTGEWLDSVFGTKVFSTYAKTKGRWIQHLDSNPNPDQLLLYRGLHHRGHINRPGEPSTLKVFPLTCSEAKSDFAYLVGTNTNAARYQVGHNVPTHAPQYNPQYAPTSADYALIWTGEAGIYNRFWREWYSFLKDSRIVKRTLLLSVADLRNFSFKQKIRLGNQVYFVKKMRVTLTWHGLQPTEVELVKLG